MRNLETQRTDAAEQSIKGVSGEALSDEELRDRINALRHIEAFAELPEEQLRWFAVNAVERRFEPGENVFRKGEPAEWMVVYLEGEIHSRPDDSTLDSYVYIARAGDPRTEVSGRLPFSRMKEWGGTALAVAPTRMLLFHIEHFPELLQRMPLLAERLVGLMSDRVREFTHVNQQRDKLMALGKLSAGLAHELNNPAAAARRAADDLLGALETLRAADLALCRHDLDAEQRRFIAKFEHEAIERTETQTTLDSLEQSDREDELNRWLEAVAVEDAWKWTPALVEAGVDSDALEEVCQRVGREACADVLRRISAQLATAKLVADIKTSASRISELVGAIKEYSYMDRSPLQEVDLHKGLENTLVILKHKLKQKSINVVREYGEDVPVMTAYGSELNQVWTNLIDNAVDALDEGGRLKIRTKREPADVLVEIRDDGKGIPKEVQARIFEPFFTTKPVGEGTGLGLDAVMRIVRKHRGDIRFESKLGDTCFQVRLPVEYRTRQS
ncbi:MAG: ATP-binding protein [Acidobacteriota bacterium]|nr:ATP-binding protein [Acidobacteriota bacterium]